ncbi:CHASE2 domain-containing protein [Candidatus Riflebacteria bacterium]
MTQDKSKQQKSQKIFSSFFIAEIYISVLLFLFVGFILLLGGFEGLENKSLDLRFQIRLDLRGKTAPKNEKIVVVGISSSDFRTFGPMPWDRKIFAQLLEKLSEFGAKAVALDVLFNERGPNPESDRYLARALTKLPVVLPKVFVLKEVFNQDTYQLEKKIVEEGPYGPFLRQAKALGFIDVEQDLLNFDGIIRHWVLVKKMGDNISRALALALYRIENQQTELNFLYPHLDLDLFNYLKDGNWSYMNFNFVETMIINFTKRHGEFVTDEVNKVLRYSTEDGKRIFKDKFVLIGALEIRGVKDIKKTPLGPMPGVEIHATVLDSLLNKNFIFRPAFILSLFLLLFAAFANAIILIRFTGRFINFAYLFFPLIFFLFCQFLFNQFSIHLPFFLIVTMVILQWVVTRFAQSYRILENNKTLIESKYKELSVIHEVSQTVTFMDDLDKTLVSILDKAIRVLEAERGSIMLYESSEDRLKVRVKRGKFRFEGSGKGLAPGEGVAGKVFLDMQAALLPCIERFRFCSQAGAG